MNIDLEEIINDFQKKINEMLEKLKKELNEESDANEVEKQLNDVCDNLIANVMEILLNEILSDPEFIKKLKALAKKLNMQHHGYRTITVRLAHGQEITVKSPYFIKTKTKRRKKRGNYRFKGLDFSHLGLVVLGFINKASAALVSAVASAAVLCPSFEVAKQSLANMGIKLDVKSIKRFCEGVMKRCWEKRGKMAKDSKAWEGKTGLTLIIGIDGGRTRIREKKKGRKKEGQTRQGYEGKWREPKIFVIYVEDEEGKRVKEIKATYDGTMENHIGLFNLLEEHLKAIPFKGIERLVFCGDGASWIWDGIERLCHKLELGKEVEIHQVLDYPHAKQNLNEILALVPDKICSEKWLKECYRMLWAGDTEGLHRHIFTHLEKDGKKKGQTKWEGYFEKNAKRMEYQRFAEIGIPCGSGCVESAIRRVINLRLKGNGIFWLKETVEMMLYLRSQWISGCWNILMNNITSEWREVFFEAKCPTPIFTFSAPNTISTPEGLPKAA